MLLWEIKSAGSSYTAFQHPQQENNNFIVNSILETSALTMSPEEFYGQQLKAKKKEIFLQFTQYCSIQWAASNKQTALHQQYTARDFI